MNRCHGALYTHVERDGKPLVKSCAGCEDCNDKPHRLAAAIDASPHTTLLERRITRLEVLLREAVIYVEPSSTDGADLRARIQREIPRKRT